jgi:hypothetical protein
VSEGRDGGRGLTVQVTIPLVPPPVEEPAAGSFESPDSEPESVTA